MRKTILFIALAIITANIFAQGGKDILAKVTLRDGSIYNGSISIKTVDLQTDYGKLTIPLKNVTSIEVGLAPDRSNKAKLDNLITQLSNEVEETRKIAYDELLKIKASELYVLTDFLYSDKYTPSVDNLWTLDQVISEIKSKFYLDDNLQEKDNISIDGQYLMGGIFTFPSIEIKTEFGALTIPKEKITKIEVTYVPSTGSETAKIINLPASKYISGNANGGWYRTGINVTKGQRISISATGEVTLASLSNAKYNPNGASGVESSYVGTGSTYPTYGQLVYKIGETGQVYTAGAKFNGAMAETGMLYISIYETVYNAANTGSYNVNIKSN
jgi:hypothetical protein